MQSRFYLELFLMRKQTNEKTWECIIVLSDFRIWQSSLKKNYKHIETKLVHSGEPHPRILGAVSMPIFQSAMFETMGERNYDDLKYIRLNNTPNHEALREKLAALEGAEDALVTASGMAAVSTTMLSVLSKGDHLLVQDCLYGGTHDFVSRDLDGFGISYNFIDGNDPNSWEKKIRPNTKAIYVESMNNPLLQIADHAEIVEFAKSHKIVSIIDNTFASPINFRPPEFGYDLSLHSCTKYLNGHSDIVAGAVIGKSELVGKVKHRLNHLGASLDPHACFLLHRGMKTLALRMRQHNESALKIAKFLEQSKAVERVNYPGLVSHPQHDRARKLFDGFSGMMSFELKGGREAADGFLRNVTIPITAPSLGGVESLITTPATTSHSGMSREDRHKLGITDGLIRLSVGIESTEDIIEDFQTVLESSALRQVLSQ
jgi:cystathionine beta-lyase/cystathionine gamma-synthase